MQARLLNATKALEKIQHEALEIQAASPECAGILDNLQSFNSAVDTAETWT
jgi:hypothetical protein